MIGILTTHMVRPNVWCKAQHSDANTEECMWAWEMVDEIDDAATRAGVRYQ